MSELNEAQLADLLKAELARSSWSATPWPRVRTRLFTPIPKPSRRTGRRMLAAAGVALIALLAVGAVFPQTRDTALAFIEKGAGINPWAGLTDAQKQKSVDATHERNAAFLRDFVRRNGDPRTLPVIKVQSEGIPPATLRQAVADAQVIVRGKVTRTSFAVDPSGGMPLATASVATLQVVQGNVPATFEVRQLGGPVAQYAGGALEELDVDAVLLPGDDVILLLRHGPDGSLRTLPGDGVLYVAGDMVRAEDGSPISAEVNGLKVADVLRSLRP
jgi:hypothetical protein